MTVGKLISDKSYDTITAAKNIVNKYVWCYILLEQQLEQGSSKLVYKRSKSIEYNLKQTRYVTTLLPIYKKVLFKYTNVRAV